MTQRVIELTDFGAAENMKLREADIPTPGPGQIVVKNNAIGLNYLDTYFRTGLYPVSYTHLTLPTIYSV